MDSSAEYKTAIDRGLKLHLQQKEMVWSTNGAARDMRASYEVNTGRVLEKHSSKIAPLLASENIPAGELMWVDIMSRRNKMEETTSLTWVHANSGALIIIEIDKEKDNNTPPNRLRPSELLWQSFA